MHIRHILSGTLSLAASAGAVFWIALAIFGHSSPADTEEWAGLRRALGDIAGIETAFILTLSFVWAFSRASALPILALTMMPFVVMGILCRDLTAFFLWIALGLPMILSRFGAHGILKLQEAEQVSGGNGGQAR